MVAFSACDRTETTVRIDDDGSGEWTRTITFTRDGLWADDWDFLAEAAATHEDDPAGFVLATIPTLFPDLADSTDALADFDQALVEDFNLSVTASDTEVQITTSDVQPDYRNMTGELALPGAFDANADGLARFRVENMVATLLSAPGLGTVGSTGTTTFTLEVPGTVVEHNADHVDGQTLRWEWVAQADTDSIAEPEQGMVVAIWSPEESGGGLRRLGLLAVAVLALAIGTAVLMTFRPPGFDDDPDDGYPNI